MFNEHEIACFLEYPEILDAVIESKKNFISTEAKFLEISDHDFLSLIIMTPTIGVTLSNGSVSLFEELALNKLARKMSKGGYFLKLDPVAHAMKFLIKGYDHWELPFFEVIKLCMLKSFNYDQLKKIKSENNSDDPIQEFAHHLMHVPYGFVKFLSSFFMNDENDIVQEREISKVEHEKILDMSRKLELDQIPAFHSFLKTFKVK